MTSRGDELPEIEVAAEQTRQSWARAERDLAQAREASARHLSLAALLRRLRQQNGFGPMFDKAFGGGGHG